MSISIIIIQRLQLRYAWAKRSRPYVRCHSAQALLKDAENHSETQKLMEEARLGGRLPGGFRDDEP